MLHPWRSTDQRNTITSLILVLKHILSKCPGRDLLIISKKIPGREKRHGYLPWKRYLLIISQKIPDSGIKKMQQILRRTDWGDVSVFPWSEQSFGSMLHPWRSTDQGNAIYLYFPGLSRVLDPCCIPGEAQTREIQYSCISLV